MEKPNCSCHNEAMRWHKDDRRRAGGYWYCVIRHRKYDRTRKYDKYHNDADFRAKVREYQRAYCAQHPDKTRERNARKVRIGETYFGVAPTAEQAAVINTYGRQMLSEFKSRLREERHAGP